MNLNQSSKSKMDQGDKKVLLKRKLEENESSDHNEKKQMVIKNEPNFKSEFEVKEDFDYDDDDEKPLPRVKVEQNQDLSRQCPYLDTIDRNVLDFGKIIKNQSNEKQK